jgi:IS30 family transposase
MNRTYNHLIEEERYHIEMLRKQKISLGKIAQAMNQNKSTFSHELKRNTGL